MSTELVISNPNEMSKYLEKAKGQMALCLPKHITPDRMTRLTLTCFSTNPALRRCTAQSIMASMVIASQLGLEIGVRGQAFLVPYKNTCTLVPGWMGLVGLLNNTGRATAWTGAVYEGDEFQFELGAKPILRHVPSRTGRRGKEMIWAYAIGKVNGSEEPVIEAWPAQDVWDHRDQYNKVGPRHYSFENPEMYARKVVLLQVLKYMPCSVELTNAVEVANKLESGASSVIIDNGIVVEQQPPTPVGSPDPEDNLDMGGNSGATADTEVARFTKAIRGLFALNNLTEPEFLAFAIKNKLCPQITTLDAGPLPFLQNAHDNWASIMVQYNKAKTTGGELSPQAKIEAAVLGAGHDFKTVVAVLRESGIYPDADSMPDIGALPKEIATRVLKQITGFLKMCADLKAQQTA